MRMRLLSALLLCFVGFSASGQTDCGWNPDANGDNEIGVPDLLALLSVFEEQDSDGDGIWDSQDDCIGTEDPCGVCNGTGLDEDLDGLCDDIDDCMGVYDECGVCNGPGPDFPVIESIEVTYDSVFIPQIEEWYVFELSIDTTFSFVCATPGCTDPEAANFNPDAIIDDGSCSYGPPECGGASTVTFDGYTYDLVAIGSQCWFAENLRSDNYSNGDSIPFVTLAYDWTHTSTGAQVSYDNDGANMEVYGRLYNWYAVDDSRGLCPSGWHVPSDTEWMALEMELGMLSTETNLSGWRGTDEGEQLKASLDDSPSWDGTNVSGFSALPGGTRGYAVGTFHNGGFSGTWWSSTSYGSAFAWSRELYPGSGQIDRGYDFMQWGFSVRCLRNE